MSAVSRKKDSADHDAKLSFPSMLKELFGLGCIGFGGGSALIPVFEERLVDTGKVAQSRFDDDVAISCITPGALPVELACAIGLHEHGAKGALAAAAAFALPGAALLLAALLILKGSSQAATAQVSFLAVGVCGYILSIIAHHVCANMRRGKTRKERCLRVLLIAGVFIITCEKSLYQLLGIDDAAPVFALETVDVMILAFFEALWIGPKRTRARIATGVCMAALYCIACATSDSSEAARLALMLLDAIMLAMAMASLRKDRKSNCPAARIQSPLTLAKTLVVFIIPTLGCVAVAMLLCGDALAFALKGALSSVLSFGGGDAYIAMADGMFVEGGMVGQDDFYGMVVPIANALPGSILCKVLTGCGVAVANAAGGSMTTALVMGMTGFAVAVSMSCITYSIASFLYNALEGLASFTALRRIIGSVVSGLLLTVSLGLLQTCASAASTAGLSSAGAVLLVLAIALANLYARKRFATSPIVAVLLSALASGIILNLV